MAVKKIGIFILRVGVSILLLVFLFSKVDGAAIWELVRASNIAGIIAAVFIVGVTSLFCFIRWDILLKASGVCVPARTLLKPFGGGLFFNMFLPTSIGGDIVRVLDLGNHTRKGAHVASTVLLDRLIGYVALDVMVLAACAVGWRYVQDPAVLWSVGIITAILVCILLVLFNSTAYNFLNKLLYSPNAGRIRANLTQAHEQLYVLGKKKRVLSVTLLISLALQLLSSVSAYVICRSLGADIPLIYFFIFVPIIGMISMLPISLGGLGVREAATVYFFAKAGLGRDAAFAMSLIGFSITVLFAAAGGLYYVITLHRRRV
ncbi:MAG: flippase-like domain-containing protein [Candidatus Omnitrophica bacterium]|nr:flippase-like domain-containing protein [Candidatus Omnitrophota bacterium]